MEVNVFLNRARLMSTLGRAYAACLHFILSGDSRWVERVIYSHFISKKLHWSHYHSQIIICMRLFWDHVFLYINCFSVEDYVSEIQWVQFPGCTTLLWFFFSVLYKSFQFNFTQHIFMILLRSRRLSSVFVRNVFKFNFFYLLMYMLNHFKTTTKIKSL